MTSPVPRYEERLRVPLLWWAIGAVLAVSLWWTFVLATPMWFALAIAAGSFIVVAVALWRWGSVRILVAGQQLRAGRAVLPLEHCSAVRPLDPDAARAQRGPLADARAYLLLRPYVSTAVRVDLADPRDPTPYWLLSTRRPADLAAVVRAGSRK